MSVILLCHLVWKYSCILHFLWKIFWAHEKLHGLWLSAWILKPRYESITFVIHNLTTHSFYCFELVNIHSSFGTSPSYSWEFFYFFLIKCMFAQLECLAGHCCGLWLLYLWVVNAFLPGQLLWWPRKSIRAVKGNMSVELFTEAWATYWLLHYRRKCLFLFQATIYCL